VQRIFISHSSRDADLAVHLVDALEASGLDCWLALRNIPLAEDYTDALVSAVESAPALVLLHTADALASRPCKDEVRLAQDADIPVVTVHVDESKATDGWRFLLGRSQALDARGAEAVWLPRLVDELRRLTRTTEGVRRPDEESGPTSGPSPRPIRAAGPLAFSMEECDALIAAAGVLPGELSEATHEDRGRFAQAWAAAGTSKAAPASGIWTRLGAVLGQRFVGRSDEDVARAFDALSARGRFARNEQNTR
jgi:hypothetical protein